METTTKKAHAFSKELIALLEKYGASLSAHAHKPRTTNKKSRKLTIDIVVEIDKSDFKISEFNIEV